MLSIANALLGKYSGLMKTNERELMSYMNHLELSLYKLGMICLKI